MRAEDEYDVVIVGGGSAGCVLAARLSADPGTRVLVLEAGGPERWWDLSVQLPIAMGFPVGSRFHDWRFESEPEPGLTNRRLHHPRGRIVGGSSSINGMIYQRGSPADFQRWATNPGLHDWDYAHCLPYFRRLEGCLDEPGGTARGRGGPQVLTRSPADGVLFDAFFGAARQSGYAVRPDLNGHEQEGFAPLDQTVKAGRRHAAAHAYLRPARSRPNLDVRCRALVTKVLFHGHRAIGVGYRSRAGGERTVRAGEVILCGGAINTPQLLQLSGVGDAGLLGQLGIPLVQPLPGVGENLQEHLAVHMQHLCPEPVSLAQIRRKVRWPGIILEALVHGRGPGALNPMQAGGFVRSSADEADPDLMFLFAPLAMQNPERTNRTMEHGYQVHVGVMRSAARGSVRITTRDPKAHPAIRLNFLSDPGDRRRWVEAVRLARGLLGQPAFRRFDGGETRPGPGIETDDQVMDWVARTARTGLHPACSARMGLDDDSVVHPGTMRVHGVAGLRVVDAAAMPSLTNANTYAPVMMIAERAADLIMGNTPLQPEDVMVARPGPTPTADTGQR